MGQKCLKNWGTIFKDRNNNKYQNNFAIPDFHTAAALLMLLLAARKTLFENSFLQLIKKPTFITFSRMVYYFTSTGKS
jgi:hypothetical protein